MERLSSTDRTSLIRLARSMPKGSPERKAILAGLKKAYSDNPFRSEVAQLMAGAVETAFNEQNLFSRIYDQHYNEDDGMLTKAGYDAIEKELVKGVKELNASDLADFLMPDGYIDE